MTDIPNQLTQEELNEIKGQSVELVPVVTDVGSYEFTFGTTTWSVVNYEEWMPRRRSVTPKWDAIVTDSTTRKVKNGIMYEAETWPELKAQLTALASKKT